MAELNPITPQLNTLITNMSAHGRKILARKIGMSLRKEQATRITAQQNPDGSAYEPRVRQARSRKMHGKKMFTKLRMVKALKTYAHTHAATVQFVVGGGNIRIAREHHFGLRVRVNKHGTMVKYPARELLGFSDNNIEKVNQLVIDHLAAGVL